MNMSSSLSVPKFPVIFPLVYLEFLKRPFLPADSTANFGHYHLMLFTAKKIKILYLFSLK